MNVLLFVVLFGLAVKFILRPGIVADEFVKKFEIKTKEELAAAYKAYCSIDGNKVTDADGNELQIEEIELKTAKAEDEEEKEADEEEEDDAEEKRIQMIVRKAFEKAQKSAPIRKPGTPVHRHAPAIKHQRFLPKASKVFKGRGDEAYEKAYEFGKVIKHFIQNKGAMPDDAGVKAILDGTGSVTYSQDGTLPIGMANEILAYTHDVSVVRRLARVVPMPTLVYSMLARINYSSASFFRDANIGGSGAGTNQIIPRFTSSPYGENSVTEPSSLFVPITFTAKEIGDIVPITKAFSDDSIAAMGAAVADDMAIALATRESYAGLLGTGAADGTDGGIIGLLNRLPAGSLKEAPAGSHASWTVDATTYASWLNALQSLMASVEWIEGGEQPKWLCSHAFYYAVMQPVMRLMGGTPAQQMAEGTAQKFEGFDVELCNLMPRVPGPGKILCVFGKFDHAMFLGDRQSVEVSYSSDATIPNGNGTLNLWASNSIGIRAIERVDFQFIDRGLGSQTTCGVVAGLKAPEPDQGSGSGSS